MYCLEDLKKKFLNTSEWSDDQITGSVGMLSLSCVQLFTTPWTVAHQAPLSMKIFRQEYWSGLPFPPPGDDQITGSGIMQKKSFK